MFLIQESQDLFGMNTLDSMVKASAKVLAIEAEKCIIIEKDEFIRKADKAGIIVVGISKEKFN